MSIAENVVDMGLYRIETPYPISKMEYKIECINGTRRPRLSIMMNNDRFIKMVLVSGKCLEECMEKLRDESKAMMQDPEGVELMDITHHATYQDGTEYSGVMVKDGQTTRMYTRMRFRNGVLYVFTMGAERELDMNLMLDCMVFRNPRSLLKGRYTIG